MFENDTGRPDQFVRQTQAIRKLDQGISKALPSVLKQAEAAIKAGDEKAVLERALPWLAKHYRGYALLDMMAQKVQAFGAPKITEARSLDRDRAVILLLCGEPSEICPEPKLARHEMP